MFWKKKTTESDDTHVERALRAGENAYQRAGFQPGETPDPLALHRFTALTDNLPSYAEWAGLDVGLDTLARVVASLRPNQKGDPRVCVLVNHANPVGVGLDAQSARLALERALAGCPPASPGGTLVLNQTLTAQMADLLDGIHPALVAAPEFEDAARAQLAAQPNAVLYTNAGLRWASVDRAIARRPVRGGLLKQEPAVFNLPDLLELEWTREETDGTTEDDLCVAFAAAWSSQHGGHEVAFARAGTLLGCAGGPTIEHAIRTALARSRDHHDLKGAVFVLSRPLRAGPALEHLVEAECRAGLLHEDSPDHAAILAAFRSAGTNIGLMSADHTGTCRL